MQSYFAEFQCWEFASAADAAPTSHIPADLASGAMVKNGTAVGSLLNCAPISPLPLIRPIVTLHEQISNEMKSTIFTGLFPGIWK